MSHRLPLKFLSVIAIAASLTGCMTRKIDRGIEAQAARVANLDARSVTPGPEVHPGLTVTTALWLGNRAIRNDHGEPLPGQFETPKGITIGGPRMSLAEIAARITDLTNIPVHVYAASAAAGPAGAFGNGKLPARLRLLRPGGFGQRTQGTVRVDFQGRLSDFLNEVVPQFNDSWRYRRGVISIYRYEIRTFLFPVYPGTIDAHATAGTSASGAPSQSVPGVAGTSAGGGATLGTSAQEVTAKTTDLNQMADIKSAIVTMLAGHGEVNVAHSTGVITVLAPPNRMRRIRRFIEAQIRRASRQVAITIQIFSVDLTNGEDYGLSFLADYAAANGMNFTVAGPPAPSFTSTTGAVSIGVLSPAPAGASSTIGRWAGSSISVKALASKVDLSVKKQISMLVPNDQIVSWVDLEQTAYVQSASTTSSSLTSSVTGIQPGIVDSGYSIVMMPQILDNGGIWLFFAPRVTDLVKISQQTSGTSTIDLPVQDEKSSVQRFLLHSGSTLVVAGSAEQNNQASANGVGDPFFNLFGGGVAGQTAKKEIVYMITPTEINTMDMGSSR